MGSICGWWPAASRRRRRSWIIPVSYTHLRVISSELGEADNPLEEADEYREKINKLQLSEENRRKLLGECDKLSKMPFGSHEATVVRNYLDTCLEIPWGIVTKDSLELTSARKILDRDHYGMEKVKERILEILAVRSLAKESKGQVILSLIHISSPIRSWGKS